MTDSRQSGKETKEEKKIEKKKKKTVNNKKIEVYVCVCIY